jgi:hypothetical protein
MKHTRVFHLTAKEMTGLAAKQLSGEYGLPPADVETQLHIKTDGKTAEIIGATVTFNINDKEPKDG